MNYFDLLLAKKLAEQSSGGGGGDDNVFIVKATHTATNDYDTSPVTVTEEIVLDGTTYQEIYDNAESGKVVFCILTDINIDIEDGETSSYEYTQALILNNTGDMMFSVINYFPFNRTYVYTNLTVYDDDTVYLEGGDISAPKEELILAPDSSNYEVGGTVNGYTVYNLDENSYSAIADSHGITNMNISIDRRVTVGGLPHQRWSKVVNVMFIGRSGDRDAYVLGYFNGNTYTEMAVFDRA